MAATRAGCAIHLTCITLVKTAAPSAKGIPLTTIRLLTYSTAFWTATWRVGKTSVGVKFLLTSSKGELLIAVAAIQGLISQ